MKWAMVDLKSPAHYLVDSRRYKIPIPASNAVQKVSAALNFLLAKILLAMANYSILLAFILIGACYKAEAACQKPPLAVRYTNVGFSDLWYEIGKVIIIERNSKLFSYTKIVIYVDSNAKRL